MDNEIKLPEQAKGKSGFTNVDSKLGSKLINAEIRKKEIDRTIQKEERGILGRFFGGKDSSSNNIAGLFICALLIIASLYTLGMAIYCPNNTHSQVLDFWGIVTPLITLALGYIFGNKEK